MNQNEHSSPLPWNKETQLKFSKATAFDQQLDLLKQLMEALDAGRPINPGSVWHKVIEDAIYQGQGLTQ